MLKIKITKKENRNLICCTRADGTFTRADLGPSLPFHDIAHYVVEKYFGFSHGFYGNIAQGYSIEELSDKNIIKTLPPESLVAEIITRSLQSVYSGACSPGEWKEMIRQELEKWNIIFDIKNEEVVLELLLKEYFRYIDQWETTTNNGSLELSFPINEKS